MSIKFIILGCGSSMGVPRPDGFFGNCDPRNKKNYRTRCSALIKTSNENVLVDTSPDLRQQLLRHKIKKIDKIIFAYEPVWSIGTGKVLTNKELTKQVINIKKIIKNKFKNQKTKIIYGGSVNNQNINNLKQIKEINGFLIGGASQNSKKFIDIIKKTIN